MHDIKIIRKNPDFFLKKLSDRNVKFDKESLLNLDKKNREIIQQKEKLEQEKKTISQKRDKSLFKQSKEASIKIDDLKDYCSQNKIKSVHVFDCHCFCDFRWTEVCL